jgi:hypothetical protein
VLTQQELAESAGTSSTPRAAVQHVAEMVAATSSKPAVTGMVLTALCNGLLVLSTVAVAVASYAYCSSAHVACLSRLL